MLQDDEENVDAGFSDDEEQIDEFASQEMGDEGAEPFNDDLYDDQEAEVPDENGGTEE